MGGSSSLGRRHDKRNIVEERLGAARYLSSPHVTFAELHHRILERIDFEVTVNALVKIETGLRPAYDYEVAALALALDVDPAYLLGLTDQAHSNRVDEDTRTAPDPPASDEQPPLIDAG